MGQGEGTRVKIWRDSKLSRTDVFSDEIFDQLRNSGVLISIVSPSGIQSNWCRDERQRFEVSAECNIGFRIDNTLRAIKVVKTPLDHDEHRPLFGVLGFEFYQRDEQSGLATEYPRSSDLFEARLNQLADDVRRIFAKIREVAPQRLKRREAVYIAIAPQELEDERQRIVTELQSWGLQVLPPAGTISAEQDGCRLAIDTNLKNVRLSVHLVGERRGPIPDGEEKPIAALQYEIAQAYNLARVVWIAPGKKPHDTFKSALQSGSQQGVEILENSSIEELKRVLEVKLKGLQKQSNIKPNGLKLNLYVLCDRRDHPYCSECAKDSFSKMLISHLRDRGYAVWLPPVSVTEQSLQRIDHEATMQVSDAVLLFWGNAEEAWFREHLRELAKVNGDRSHRPFVARAVYLSKPPNPSKAQAQGILDMVIEQYDTFQPEALKALEERLSAAANSFRDNA